MRKRVEELIEKVREHPQYCSLGEKAFEDLNFIEDDEVYSTEVDFSALENAEVDDDLKELLLEIVDLALERAALWEFANSLSWCDEEKIIGPVLDVAAGRVHPVWDGDSLVMEGVDEYIYAEIYTGPTPAPELVMELIDEYVEGR